MGWKLFSALNALLVFSLIFGHLAPPHYGVIGLLSTTLAVPAALGVFLYAFTKPEPSRLWEVFSWMFAADSIVVLAYSIARLAQLAPGHSIAAVAVLLALIIAYQYFTWTALCRLGGKRLPRVARSAAASRRPAKTDADDVPHFKRYIATMAAEHPIRAKIISFSVLVTMFTVTILLVWSQIEQGRGYRLIVPFIIGIVQASRGYKTMRDRRRNAQLADDFS